MSEPIKPGDLVVVLSNHCSDEFVGAIFVAGESVSGNCTCHRCGATKTAGIVLIPELDRRYPYLAPCGLERSFLKRIPPIEELEGQKDSSGLDERQKVGNRLLTGTEFYEALRKMAEGLRS